MSQDLSPLASVVVCTYSRERLPFLEDTLESLESQTYGSRETVLVIDHNPALAAELKATVSDSIRLVESTGPKGLSGARNSGVKHARGEIVAFIDDDARADSAWLEQLVASYRDEGVLGVGGQILPVWQGGNKPGWFPEEFLWVVGCSYRGLPDSGPVRNLIGCNMSFRSRVFEDVGGFDASIGRLGTQLLGCEETELCIRALKRWPDQRIVLVPDAVVHHHVPKSRQTVSYLMRRCYTEGIAKAAVRKLAGPIALSSEKSYATRTLAAGVLSNLRDAIVFRHFFASVGQILTTGLGLMVASIGYLVGMVRSRTKD